MKDIQLPFYIRFAFILLMIVLIIFLLYVGQDVLIPLFFAVLISFLLYPMASYMETKMRMSRGISSILSVTAFVTGLGIFLYFLTYQILLFSQDIPLLQNRISQWLIDVQVWFTREYQIDSTQQVGYMHDALDSITRFITNSLGGLFIEMTEVVFWVIIIFIYTYFILHHRRLLVNFMLAIFPKEDDMKVRKVISETRVVTNNYIIGLFIEFVVVAIANCVAFVLLDIRYWLLLGIISAALNFIPYLGIIVATILVWLVTMIHGSPMLAFQAAAILFALHVLDANILLPRVVGHKVQINALITIISVLIGGAIWGIAGMFLSIPVTAMLKIIFEHINKLKPWAMLMGVDDTMEKK